MSRGGTRKAKRVSPVRCRLATCRMHADAFEADGVNSSEDKDSFGETCPSWIRRARDRDRHVSHSYYPALLAKLRNFCRFLSLDSFSSSDLLLLLLLFLHVRFNPREFILRTSYYTLAYSARQYFSFLLGKLVSKHSVRLVLNFYRGLYHRVY